MTDFYTHMDTDKRLTEAWRKHCKDAGSDESYSDWLIDKLIDAEAKVVHHAEIASVCSATAERYATALDSILEFCKEDSQRGNEASALRILVSAKAKEVRKEAE